MGDIGGKGGRGGGEARPWGSGAGREEGRGGKGNWKMGKMENGKAEKGMGERIVDLNIYSHIHRKVHKTRVEEKC